MPFFLPSFARFSPTPRRGRVVAPVLAASILGLTLFAGAPTAAHAESAFDVPESPLIEMQTDADGNWFWQVTVTSDSAYIATWEREEGIWPNADVAMQAGTALAQCRSDGKRAYLDRFTTYAEFAAAPNTQIEGGVEGASATWTSDDPAFLAAHAVCNEQSEWDWTQNVSTATGAPNQKVIAISSDQMGPGSHTLFIASMEYPDSQECSITWPDGGLGSYGCLPTFIVEEMTVAVAYPDSTASVLPGPLVGNNTAFDASIFSDLALTGQSPEADAGPLQASDLTITPPIGPLLITVALTLIFAILIALPSALLEATIENNESRIGAFLKKILPPRRRTAPRAKAVTASGIDS
ncbi:hypothetical protein [Cryobacterium sp. Y11]|uniref:hypothetical protein n=1 Tax=Cryobacterium sp. Y11 TaxID=2045016 RepID=UPI0011B0F234|nr:hypothetical protein [Cryobacterium sp. Y11]